MQNVYRKSSTTAKGVTFDAATVRSVWSKAIVVPGIDPRVRRKDIAGAWIDFAEYGVTTHLGHGWEIDHIRPISKGGADNIDNLQPLQWQNNRTKGDSESRWAAAVVARG